MNLYIFNEPSLLIFYQMKPSTLKGNNYYIILIYTSSVMFAWKQDCEMNHTYFLILMYIL